MSSLVEELQRDALNGDVDISDLLRKAYVVATKLKLDRFREWCNLELNGYPDSAVPEYRRISGTVRAWNPFNGWIPFVTNNLSIADQLSNYVILYPVGQVQRLVASAEENTLKVVYPPDTQFRLMELTGLEFQFSLHFHVSGVTKILDAARNTILDWSLKLEEDGILGEGMSFSPDEKKLASKNSEELQSIVNNYITIDTMVNSSLQQGSPGAKQRRNQAG